MQDRMIKNNQMIIWFLGLKPHPVHGDTYFLWDVLNPVIEMDNVYDTPGIKYVDFCHINQFKFESDWNWLIHLVKEIRKKIIIPMDSDMNNWKHEQYQSLKGYLEAKVVEVDQSRIYAASMEILDWWFLMSKWKEKQKEKTV